jgi:quercetin dioxygenase-like cupin family protein/DNA-binding XRE family transcriptional regulator
MPAEVLETELVRLGARLRTLRAERGWTLEALSERASLSSAHLSRIEAGERQASLAALIALAQSFEIPIAALFDSLPARASIAVTRAGTGTPHASNGAQYTPLTGKRDPTHLNAVLLDIPVARGEHAMNRHDSEEFVYVLEGTVKLIVGEESAELHAGDAAHYDAREAHRLDALGKPARALLVATTVANTAALELRPTQRTA